MSYLRTGTFLIVPSFACAAVPAASAKEVFTKEDFDILDLSKPGLEAVKAAVDGGRYDEAANALLACYRRRFSDDKPDGRAVAKDVKESADNALLHRFRPQKGYGFFDYGRNIDWTYWPVKDNEVRWQLHRVEWWSNLAKTYTATRDERYAKEWVDEFRDWEAKNALGKSKENDRFAWRALEISARLKTASETLPRFVASPQVTPAFLLEFLASFDRHAEYLGTHYAAAGNHRLFEAERVLAAGGFLPELAHAAAWRKSGIGVLNEEIGKQVYPDGMQFELSLAYHKAMIDTFLGGYQTAKRCGAESEFPASYLKRVESMIMAVVDVSFPDGNLPMFGDSWPSSMKEMLPRYLAWSETFPDNPVIRYYATEGREGRLPDYTTAGLTTAGLYSFRSGWDMNATVLTLKASPPGEFHAQPDNGTFELWVKGRDFTPDSGCYVYSGDAEIMKERNRYRRSCVHDTLTLDDMDMVITKAALRKWAPEGKPEILSYTNPSYAQLDHRRSVLFVDKKFFLIVDEAIGSATGRLGVHFQLKEDAAPKVDASSNTIATTYKDGNNLLIRCFTGTLREEKGFVSYSYRKELARPAFVFEKPKTGGADGRFVSILYPFNGGKAPVVTLRENSGNDYDAGKLDVTLVIDGTEHRVIADLK